jgi:hypothetical protein
VRIQRSTADFVVLVQSETRRKPLLCSTFRSYCWLIGLGPGRIDTFDSRGQVQRMALYLYAQ